MPRIIKKAASEYVNKCKLQKSELVKSEFRLGYP